MDVAVLGGGPAGLYFAISMKLRDPEHRITVIERNRPDDTFGWGVVLSDEMLDNLAANDPVSAAAIREHFAYWDDIAVVLSGVVGSWISLSILYPIEHARNCLSNSIGSHKNTIFSSMGSTVKRGGFRSCTRVAPYRWLELLFLEALISEYLTPSNIIKGVSKDGYWRIFHQL